MIQLRDYQQTLVAEARQMMQQGHSRVIMCAPTGAGKRIIACWLAAQRASMGKRTGFITDRRQLIFQAADECHQRGIKHGLVMADSPRSDDAPLQLCMLQTLQKRGWKDLPKVDAWIIDEAHKATDGYTELLKQYPADVQVISLTATPVGAQGRSLVASLGPIVEPIRTTDLIQRGWILPTKLFAPSEPNMKGVQVTRSGEYSQNKLGERVEECTVFADIFEHWRPYSDEQTMVFVPRVKYAYGLQQDFTRRGYAAAVIEAETKQKERERILAAYDDRSIRVLLNVATLVEGFDAPQARVGIDLTPCAQLRTYIQKVGRVRRPHPGQDHAVWLDFSGNAWKFPHPDDNPDWPQDEEETTQEIIKRKREEQEENADKDPWRCPSCGYILATWERIHNSTCPKCGRVGKRPYRQIRMGNGELVKVNLQSHKQRRQSKEASIWSQKIHVCLYRGYPIKVARQWYMKETGKKPHAGLKPQPPPDGSPDWNYRPHKLWPHYAEKLAAHRTKKR